MTYLFDLWPQNNDMSMFGAILHMWTKIGDENFDQYLWDSEQWHFHFKMNIEGWDSEVTLWRHRPPDQCQKYFFLGNFRRSFRIFGQN